MFSIIQYKFFNVPEKVNYLVWDVINENKNDNILHKVFTPNLEYKEKQTGLTPNSSDMDIKGVLDITVLGNSEDNKIIFDIANRILNFCYSWKLSEAYCEVMKTYLGLNEENEKYNYMLGNHTYYKFSVSRIIKTKAEADREGKEFYIVDSSIEKMKRVSERDLFQEKEEEEED